MRRLLSLVTVFAVLGSILAVGQVFSSGTLVGRVQAQQQAIDPNGNGCIDEGEVPVWRTPPVRIFGPPAELADPAGPPVNVGPSLYEFTLGPGEVYLPGCGGDAEVVLVVDGAVSLTVSDTPSPSEDIVSFDSMVRAEQCPTREGDAQFCAFEAEAPAPVELGSGDEVYHPSGSRYVYALAPADGATPGVTANSSSGYAAGGVRAAAAPLAQQGARIQVGSRWSKPQGCGGDCR